MTPSFLTQKEAAEKSYRFTAVVAGQAATFVTLASGADVFAGVAARIRRLHGSRGRWLQARGPGGEVSLKLTHAMSEDALAALLRTLWEEEPADHTAIDSSDDDSRSKSV